MGHTLRLNIAGFVLIALFFAPQSGFAQSGIDLAVHYVEGEPINNEIAYNVNVYISLVDDTGSPIRDLTDDAFTISEDSQKVDITSVGLVDDEPINIVLIMDTSGSMSGTGIVSAKTAASNFVSGLREDDQAALITFDDEVQTRINFTSNPRTINDQIALIEAKRNSGTCLYDAAYEAIQMVSTLPSGRRALILFTDGVDETRSGKTCSRFTVDDVIKLASEGGTRVPIYTLGLGLRIDTNTLQRISKLTGGHNLYSPDPSQLEETFQLLSSQLRSQYLLKYRSLAPPGAHTLAVNINYKSTQDNDTRSFLLPALRPQITFISPLDGNTVGDELQASIALLGQGSDVDRVEFRVNDKLAGADDTTPYEVKLDLREYPEGPLTISAIAYGSDNSELASNSIAVTYAITPTISPTSVSAKEPDEKPETTNNVVILVGGGLAALGLITIIILVLTIVRQRNSGGKQGEAQRHELPSQPHPQVYRESAVSRADANGTMDSYEEDLDAFGSLTIESSDDETMVGHRFELTSPMTTLGRSADNDINFPKDNPVSRRHAEIFERNGKLYLKEVETMDSKGGYAPPKYGTFVNEIPLGAAEVELNTGDEIQLGKRVRLKFKAYKKLDEDESLTYDDMTEPDDLDKTQDSF